MNSEYICEIVCKPHFFVFCLTHHLWEVYLCVHKLGSLRAREMKESVKINIIRKYSSIPNPLATLDLRILTVYALTVTLPLFTLGSSCFTFTILPIAHESKIVSSKTIPRPQGRNSMLIKGKNT